MTIRAGGTAKSKSADHAIQILSRSRQWLAIGALCERLGLSRTGGRELFRRLESKGLVVSRVSPEIQNELEFRCP